MLVFIIPVKSPAISPNWLLFSRLFERCLKSVCNQTSANFKVVVVCNEKPQTTFDSSHVEYLTVDFPPPGSEEVSLLIGIQSSKEADKAKKILAGLAYAKKFNPSHTMVVDADDCINKNIAQFVEQNPDADGWYIKKGYVYKEGKPYIYLNLKNFNHLCGTSIIIKYNLAELLINNGKHYDHCAVSLANGVQLQPLPFTGAIYSIENQENYRMSAAAVKELKNNTYQKGITSFLEKITKYRIYLLTNSIRQQFGLSRLESLD
ncbi:MAG: glycosyltransferase family A protein [Pleurocapsa sp.]